MARFEVEIDEGDPSVAGLLRDLAERGRVTPLQPMGRRTLITGGARSGKSSMAEQTFAGEEHVDYVATSDPRPDDPEWAERIAQHRARRPAGWRTVETLDLAGILATDDPAPVLVDCVGVWLTRQMDAAGAWEERPGATERIAGEIDALVAAVADTSRRVILVTNEVGSGVVPATASGRLFRDSLGRLNARLAGVCDDVWLCTAGLGQRLKG